MVPSAGKRLSAFMIVVFTSAVDASNAIFSKTFPHGSYLMVGPYGRGDPLPDLFAAQPADC